MVKKKHVKIGIVFVAVAAIAIGLGVGLSMKDKSQNANVRSSANAGDDMSVPSDTWGTSYDPYCDPHAYHGKGKGKGDGWGGSGDGRLCVVNVGRGFCLDASDREYKGFIFEEDLTNTECGNRCLRIGNPGLQGFLTGGDGCACLYNDSANIKIPPTANDVITGKGGEGMIGGVAQQGELDCYLYISCATATSMGATIGGRRRTLNGIVIGGKRALAEWGGSTTEMSWSGSTSSVSGWGNDWSGSDQSGGKSKGKGKGKGSWDGSSTGSWDGGSKGSWGSGKSGGNGSWGGGKSKGWGGSKGGSKGNKGSWGGGKGSWGGSKGSKGSWGGSKGKNCKPVHDKCAPWMGGWRDDGFWGSGSKGGKKGGTKSKGWGGTDNWMGDDWWDGSKHKKSGGKSKGWGGSGGGWGGSGQNGSMCTNERVGIGNCYDSMGKTYGGYTSMNDILDATLSDCMNFCQKDLENPGFRGLETVPNGCNCLFDADATFQVPDGAIALSGSGGHGPVENSSNDANSETVCYAVTCGPHGPPSICYSPSTPRTSSPTKRPTSKPTQDIPVPIPSVPPPTPLSSPPSPGNQPLEPKPTPYPSYKPAGLTPNPTPFGESTGTTDTPTSYAPTSGSTPTVSTEATSERYKTRLPWSGNNSRGKQNGQKL